VSGVAEPSLADGEQLARYIFRREHIRSQTGEVKPDAFMPHPHRDCSVTRRATLSEMQVWERGEGVAAQRKLPLVGRADVTAGSVRGAGLTPVPDPVEGNPEHANIIGWPAEKAAQKQVAQLLVKSAAYKPKVAT
jgi:hypothetical protein